MRPSPQLYLCKSVAFTHWSLLCEHSAFLFKMSDHAIPRKTKIPVWTEEEGAIRNSPAPSALTVLHCGANHPTFCGRDENEECVLEGKAQGRHRSHIRPKVRKNRYIVATKCHSKGLQAS